MQYQIILISFAGNARLYILIFKIIWVAPTLGPVLIPLCSTSCRRKYANSHRIMTFTVSFTSKRTIKVFVLLGSLTVMFKEAFYDVFLPLIYIFIQRILKAFSSS